MADTITPLLTEVPPIEAASTTSTNILGIHDLGSIVINEASTRGRETLDRITQAVDLQIRMVDGVAVAAGRLVTDLTTRLFG